MTSSETPQSLHCLNTIADKLGICSSLSNLNNNSTNSSLNSISTASNVGPVQQQKQQNSNSSGIIANNGCSNSVYSLQQVVSSSSTVVNTVTTSATNSAPPSPSSSPSSLTASIGGVNGGSNTTKLNHCQLQASQLHQQTNGSSPTKITENHLSTKLLRSTSAPYPSPRAHLANSKHQDQSNHFANGNGVNSTLVTAQSDCNNTHSGAFQNQQDCTMLDNVSQLEESIILESQQQNINNNNHQQHLHSDYPLQGEREPNGNCIVNNSEFQQVIDNQHSSSSSCLPNSDININSVSNNSECPSLSTSCDLQLDTSGNSPSGNLVVDINSTMPSGPTNGMTSPGGSLDENDCDNK